MKKRGISLILLVITIIIIIIIASAVILNLNNNNPVDKARVATVQSARDSLRSGINLYIGKIMVKENGNHYASTMILGKNSSVINYSIVIDYSIYRTVKGNLNVWELDYDAVADKVNLKLDIYDSNSRWYIDEYGNPYLVYNSLENVSPYLKTEDGSAILASVSDFVVIPGDNEEFAYKGEFYQAKKSRTNVVNSLNTYLANLSAVGSSTTLQLLTDSTNGIASANDTTTITLNGEETTIYKINAANFAAKVGVSLESYDSANWYVDENANTYLIFNSNANIPESLSGTMLASSYVTTDGGEITSYTANTASNDNNNNNQSGGNNNNDPVNKEDGNITLSSTKGALTYGNSVDITVTTEDYSDISVATSDDTVATASRNGNTVTVIALSKAGDATITITGVENNNFNAVSKEYKVSVWSGTGAMPIGVAKATINSSNIASYIGTQVSYSPTGGGRWRIFYLDTAGKYGDGENALYIKRDCNGSLTRDPNNYAGYITSGYTDDEIHDITELMKKMNPSWGTKDGILNQNNEYFSAYLCNTYEWLSYKAADAIYAVGSPSVEMYMDAYNQWGGYELDRGPQIYKFDSGACGYNVGVGYYPNNGYQNNYSLNAGPSNIFCSSYWWIASPSSGNVAGVLEVNGNSSRMRVDYDTGNTNGICPVVCLGN